MSKYQEGESMSKVSEFLIKHLTNLDPHSLTPFEETVIEGIVMILILLIIISVIAGKKPKTILEVKTCQERSITIESKDEMTIVGYQPKKHEGAIKDPPKER